MVKLFQRILIAAVLAACSSLPQPAAQPTGSLPVSTASAPPSVSFMPTPIPATATAAPTQAQTPTPVSLVPPFKHIVLILFENEELTSVIGNHQMPNFNKLAKDYTLLTQHFAIRHPSLPNYIALISGDTYKFDSDNPHFYITAPSLPDELESSGLTWKAYEESMPKPCGLEDTLRYVQKHNPFVWFTSIRNDAARCSEHVVPLTVLDSDLQQNSLPNFMFIMPNECNSAHDAFVDPGNCSLGVMDNWLKGWMDKLLANPSMASDGLIIVTWDEGQGDHGCCGLTNAGGRIPTLLISSKVKKGFQDETPYTHYSILKTISEAWGLTPLGHAADPQNSLITAPWIK